MCRLQVEAGNRLLPDRAFILSDATKLRAALEEILDAAERAMAGFPIESEEWYARRDYARNALEDTKERDV